MSHLESLPQRPKPAIPDICGILMDSEKITYFKHCSDKICNRFILLVNDIPFLHASMLFHFLYEYVSLCPALRTCCPTTKSPAWSWGAFRAGLNIFCLLFFGPTGRFGPCHPLRHGPGLRPEARSHRDRADARSRGCAPPARLPSSLPRQEAPAGR